jgi:hypothetical protein
MSASFQKWRTVARMGRSILTVEPSSPKDSFISFHQILSPYSYQT